MIRLALILFGSAAAFAQSYPRHNVSVALGAALPRGDLKPYMKDAFVLGAGYGYRFHPYFQLDIGIDTAFGAAGVRDFLPTGIGDFRIKDYQYFVPMGGRAIAPLGDRIMLFGGGGGAYMRYSERVNQPSEYYQIDCPVCTARSGWGYYATAGGSAFLDSGRHFRLGVVSRVYRGHTDGEPIGNVPGFRTRDHWISVMGEFGLSF
jgi:hypothetical protein